MTSPSGWKNALREATFTITPSLRGIIAATAARVARNAAKKLSCIEASKSASLVCRKPSTRNRTPPTLLTSTSTRPCRSRACPTSRSDPPGSTRSTSNALTRSMSSNESIVSAPATTSAPSAASIRVIARPIPLLAPVTTATLPVSSRSMTRCSRDVLRRRHGERRRRGLEGREREHEDPLGRRRAEPNACPPETAVEEQLDDEAAEGVADEHGRLVERADLLLVVVDDLGDAEPLELVRLRSQLLDVPLLARPLGCRDGKAALVEVVGEVLPAPRREPGAMDQHQRNTVAIGAAACHKRPPVRRLRWRCPLRDPRVACMPTYSSSATSAAASSIRSTTARGWDTIERWDELISMASDPARSAMNRCAPCSTGRRQTSHGS